MDTSLFPLHDHWTLGDRANTGIHEPCHAISTIIEHTCAVGLRDLCGTLRSKARTIHTARTQDITQRADERTFYRY